MRAKALAYLALCFYIFSFTARSSTTNLSTQVSAEYAHSDNIMNAYKAADIYDDQTHTVLAKVSYALPITINRKVNFVASAKANRQQSFSMLNNTELALGAWYGWQNKFEYLAPYYIVSANIKTVNSRSNARDAKQLDLTFIWNKRLTDVLQMRAGLNSSHITANKKVFDQTINQAFGQAEYKLTNNWQLHLRVNYAMGDLVSSQRTSYCINDQETSQVYTPNQYNYLWYDQDINQNLCGDWYSYNYSGRFYTGYIAGHYKSNAHKISLKVQRAWTHADNSVSSYQKNELSVSYRYKF
ncbi:hypothetical protein DS2_18288 [Catenovulum agarivorans DS-2]|uniref:Uncharacterized protein n=1 Tax=Catenovulum agarivorans DS-2 TaxID=1328313 RepID=W7QH25_9ALTE|nr:hypothetical protein [Catenovulum agarivorans]EWH08257.1 hypothetical protein DS2_18288 [Catenovulum agarivorans DS-2]